MLNEAISKMPTVFESSVLLRGQEYFLKGLVLNVRLSEGLLRGRVKGSSSQIYDIHIDLKSWPQQPARCSCMYQKNCKHAAACLFLLWDKEQSVATSSPERFDRKLEIWLKNLRAQEAQTVSNKSVSTHHLIYLIQLKLDGYEHKVIIRLALAKLLKKGGYGKKILFNTIPESKKQHFIDDDEDLVAKLLFKCNVSHWFSELPIRNSELLERLLATGRAFFMDHDHVPIELGDALSGACQWVLAANGTQRLVLMDGEEILTPVLLDESWYFDLDDPQMGRLNTPYPAKQLRHLLDAPPIPLGQTELFIEKMTESWPDFPVPQAFKQKKIKEIKPVPILILDAVHKKETSISWLYQEDDLIEAILTARIFFDYEGVLLSSEDDTPYVMREEQGVLFEYQRAVDFEREQTAHLRQHLLLREGTFNDLQQNTWNNDPFFILEDIHYYADLQKLCTQAIPSIKQQGWQVQYKSPFYQDIVHADDVEWFSDLNEQTTDFFSYQLGIMVEGKTVSIVPLVADLIQRYTGASLDLLPDEQQVNLPLEEGKALQVPLGRIKPLVRLLLHFGTRLVTHTPSLVINKYQALLLQEAELALAAVRARWQGAHALREELQQLVTKAELPYVLPPKGLKAQLRDYQLYGLSWLQFLRKSCFNGVLADDMGLGKTIQTLAHLLYEKEQGRLTAPALMIAPTSLVGNWQAEAQRFTPELKVLVYHGSSRHQDDFEDYDLIISTYGLVHRDKDKFIQTNFYYLILDEAQFIKNARTKTTQVIQQLKATHRLCLSGTPLENHLGELWSLFHFLMPGLLGDAKQFRLWFRTPIEKNADNERRELLANRIKPFMLRRTKNQVASELPPKTEMIRKIELGGAQRDLYEAIRMSMEKKVRDAIAKQGLGKSHILLLDALLKLRQVCCDPRLLSFSEAEIAHGVSEKLNVLMELLSNLVEEKRRVLIFSQFTSMLQLIEQELIKNQYVYLKLTGQTQNRHALVEQFQQGNIPIFLISLKAGGTGLNLTKADTVIHYDPWWNPAVEDQATDRTHRIGQENPVFVYKLITSGTVEEAILSMQERKRQLVDGILSADASKTLTLTEADLEQFFMPLGE